MGVNTAVHCRPKSVMVGPRRFSIVPGAAVQGNP